MAVTVDQMLEEIGSFERYQWMLLGLFGYVIIVAGGFPVMIVTFITAEPDWICVKGYNTSVCNFTEPISLTSKNYNARCTMPRGAWTYVEGFSSTVTEYDLVCDKSYLQSIAQSCAWAGMLVGLCFGGFASDRYGRKVVIYLGTVVVLFATWLMVFPRYFAVFIACRILSGLGGGFINSSLFVLLTEFTGKMDRARIGISSFYFWVISLPILALLGYLLLNWRHFVLATAVAATPLLIIWWLTPESLHWLQLHGKPEKAKEQLVKVARINKRTFPQDELETPTLEKKGNFCQLFSNLEVTKRTLINLDLWLTVNLVYYGVSYGSVDLGWNRYLAFALTSLVEFPSNYAAIWALGRYGRKISTVSGLVIASIASIIAVSIPFDQTRKASVATISRIIVAVIAKFAINFSFSSIYVWTVELFPTGIRSIALSSSSAAGRIGSFAASYVIWLIRVHPMLPFGIMGLMCFKSAILSMFLPETNGQPTMETMSQMTKKRDIILVSSLEKESAINSNKQYLGKMYLDNQV